MLIIVYLLEFLFQVQQTDDYDVSEKHKSEGLNKVIAILHASSLVELVSFQIYSAIPSKQISAHRKFKEAIEGREACLTSLLYQTFGKKCIFHPRSVALWAK